MVEHIVVEQVLRVVLGHFVQTAVNAERPYAVHAPVCVHFPEFPVPQLNEQCRGDGVGVEDVDVGQG